MNVCRSVGTSLPALTEKENTSSSTQLATSAPAHPPPILLLSHLNLLKWVAEAPLEPNFAVDRSSASKVRGGAMSPRYTPPTP